MLAPECKIQEFVPVNDEYQPFPIVERRNFFQYHLELPLLLRVMKLPIGARILEIGCGVGIALGELARACKPSRLVGVDIDLGLLQKARSRSNRLEFAAEFYQEDVRQLHFSKESFDLVIDFGTCYHINRRVKSLREIVRVLRPGGIFIHETRFNQFVSHPIRSLGQRIPWRMASELQFEYSAVFWTRRVKKS